MLRISIISAAAATVVGALALGVVPTVLAAVSRPNVTIRIEGAKRTLMPRTTVRAPGRGWVTKDGAPKGKCPADSAAGVLNLATHGSWSGSWSSKYDDYLITKILGDTESGAKSYWEILVNNVPASTGACQIKLRAGKRLLFAAMPFTGTGEPLIIKAPRTASAGAPLKVAVDYVTAKGAAKPLAGATVRTSRGAHATTNRNGIVTMRPRHRGNLTLRAHKAGYIRAAARTVKVGSQARAARAADSPLAYLLGAQNHDGGYGPGRGQASSTLYSGWAALALIADGRNPARVTHGGRSLLAYIKATVAKDPGSLERTILVACADGVPATNFGGHNLLASLKRDIRPNGSVAGRINLTTFAILALRAAAVTPSARTLHWLVRQQNANGGFSFAKRGDLADVDDTGAALEALAGTSDRRARRHAVFFVRTAQNRDGGFPAEPGGSSNAQSTAWAVQGLIAAGVNPARVHSHGSPSPLHYLGSLITRRGAIDYARGVSLTPVWVTAEAILALDGKPLPLRSLAKQ
jgi:hypothetical protein